MPIGQEDFEFQTDYLWSLSLGHEAGPWRLKAGWSAFRIAQEAAPLAALHSGLDAVAAAGLAGVSAEAAMLRRETAFADARIDYLTLGAAFDDGRWFAQAELGRSSSTATIAPQVDAGYLAIGRRFGTLSPFVMASASYPRRAIGQPQNNWNPAGPTANALRDGAYSAFNGTRVDQHTLTTGLRWDFHAQAAAKLQWDRVHVEPEGYALWFRSLDTNPRASRINLLTLSVDFVF